MNYNTDPQLFINLRTSQLALPGVSRTALRVSHSHIYCGPDPIARFDSDAQAGAALGMAGWFKKFHGVWEVEA